MPRQEKLKLSSLVDALPKLLRFSQRGRGKHRTRALKQLSPSQRDQLAKIVQLSLDNIPSSSLTSRQLSQINSDKESLSFLRQYSKCSRKNKSCMTKKRDAYLSQCGRGMKTVLDITLPVLTQVMKEILHPASQSAARSRTPKKSNNLKKRKK